MNQYWPMAVALDPKGNPESLFTCNSCLDIDKARQQMKLWQDHYKYKLLVTWINRVDEDGNRTILDHRCHVNAIGSVEPY